MNNIGTKCVKRNYTSSNGFRIVMNSIGTKFPEITEL